MPISAPSADEIVETLKRSSLPAVIVEGKDDVAIYRWIQEKARLSDVDIFPCTGRNTLLKVFERRNEFSHLKITFIADTDMWIFSSIPEKYKEIIFTTGYSIENDLFAGSRDAIDRLLEHDNIQLFEEIIEKINLWYAYEVEQFLKGEAYSIDHNINRIISSKTNNLCEHFLADRDYRAPSEERVNELNSEYALKLRGKLIFGLLEKLLSDKKYKSSQLHEMIVKFTDSNEYIDALSRRMIESLEGSIG